MATSLTVKVDIKGRLLLPKSVREGLGIEPGDTLFVDYDEEHQQMRLAKAENPFDLLVEHALAEHKAGRTRNLREFAAENNIALDAD
jgi:AbrB family looped-hinge helix DNA binding protein